MTEQGMLINWLNRKIINEKGDFLENIKNNIIEKEYVNHPEHYNNKYECIDVMEDVFGQEATFNFCGGVEKPGGITGIYGDIIKNITGEKTEKIKFPMWYILKIMDILKVKKIHFKCYPERRHLSFKIGNYNFLAMA